MVQIIAGAKGKGKTKYLLDMANTAVKEARVPLSIWIRVPNICMSWITRFALSMYRNIRLIPAMDLSDLFVVLSARIMIWSRCILTASWNLPASRSGYWRDLQDAGDHQWEISCKIRFKHIHECSRSSRVRERKCCSIFIRDSKWTKPQLSAQGGDRRLSDSSEKGELDGLFFLIF